MPRLRHMLLAALAIPALTLGAIACGDDDDSAESNSSASAQDVDAINAHLQRNEMMFALVTLGTLELHDMDEHLNNEGTIESSFSPNTTLAVRLLHLTDWGEFQADADTVKGHAQDLLTALHAEDVQSAAAAASLLHDSEHELNEAVWNDLAEDLPPDLGGPEAEHDDSAAQTPEAGATEEGEDHDEGEPEGEPTP